MAKWVRYNADLGCMYEIPEKLALKKIKSRKYVQHFDDYYEKFTDMWQNVRDPWRDIILKIEG